MAKPFRICIVMLALSVSGAHADGEILNIITTADEARLDTFEAVRERAFDRVGNDPSSYGKAELEAATGPAELSFHGFDMTGTWRCRTIKLGLTQADQPEIVTPIVVFPWYECRVDDDGRGWRLKKVGGTERTEGRFFTDSDTRLTYLGVVHEAGTRAPSYGASAVSDMAGYAFRMGEDHWRIEFPDPPAAIAAEFQILELQRVQ